MLQATRNKTATDAASLGRAQTSTANAMAKPMIRIGMPPKSAAMHARDSSPRQNAAVSELAVTTGRPSGSTTEPLVFTVLQSPTNSGSLQENRRHSSHRGEAPTL